VRADLTLLTLSDAPISSGSFADVYSATLPPPPSPAVHQHQHLHHQSQEPTAVKVAVKVVHGSASTTTSTTDLAVVIKQLDELIPASAAHPNLVQFYGAVALSPHGLCLVMDRVTGQYTPFHPVGLCSLCIDSARADTVCG
jgi:hypothetical protein